MSLDVIAPTPERLSKAVYVEKPAKDQKTKRDAWRIVSPVETMYKRGQLSEECWQAYQRFERDLDRADRVTSAIAKYGERAGAGGTPVSQLATEVICPEDIKIAAIQRVEEAMEAIGHTPTIAALKTAILKETTLEEIGRKFGGWRNKAQACAAAVTMIQHGCYRLAVHYGYLRKPGRPPS
jgi:hypothetical protein